VSSRNWKTFAIPPIPDVVHDLRVAIRRCRSIAAVMEEVDPDPVWSELRKVTRKLFRSLGALRDGQVMDEWVKKLAPETDAVRAHLHSAFESASRGCERTPFAWRPKIDVKSWKHLEHTVRRRSRLVPTGSLAAECLALERFESAKELHAKALRTEKSKPWHALRIGLKRFRYTVEGLLPDQYAAWSDNLKRLQDILGEIHDLDVLAGKVNKSDHLDTEDSVRLWHETIERERHDAWRPIASLRWATRASGISGGPGFPRTAASSRRDGPPPRHGPRHRSSSATDFADFADRGWPFRCLQA